MFLATFSKKIFVNPFLERIIEKELMQDMQMIQLLVSAPAENMNDSNRNLFENYCAKYAPRGKPHQLYYFATQELQTSYDHYHESIQDLLCQKLALPKPH